MDKPTIQQMKQELIEEHREINIYDDWADPTYEWFEEYLATRGIEWKWEHNSGRAREMTWSGFCSQGDGFSFGGKLQGRDVFKFIGEKYPMIRKLIDEGQWFKATWSTSHRHNHTTPVEIDHETFRDMAGDNPLVDIWDDELSKEVENFETDLEEDIDSLCSMMYRKLEEEYEYLTSDKLVWEGIDANELNSITNDEGEVTWL